MNWWRLREWFRRKVQEIQCRHEWTEWYTAWKYTDHPKELYRECRNCWKMQIND